MRTNRFGDNSWGWAPDRADATGRTCVEIYVDPACPWSWLTSRWLVEVAPHRNLNVRWRPYSVLLHQESAGPPHWQAARWRASLRAVRVMQAVEVQEPAAVGGLYEALIAEAVSALNDRRAPFTDLSGTLRSAGLPTRYAATADDPRFDAQINRTMGEATAVIGTGVGTPSLVIRADPPVGLLGPVLAAPVTGEEALGLWDAVLAFAGVPGALELSRPRCAMPAIPDLRPALSRAAKSPADPPLDDHRRRHAQPVPI